MKNLRVIALCGSAKFKDEFLDLEEKLTLNGNIVLLPVFFSDKITITKQQQNLLKELHLKRIAMSDEILVINKNGYIGDSTSAEIEYAKQLNKKIVFLEPK